MFLSGCVVMQNRQQLNETFGHAPRVTSMRQFGLTYFKKKQSSTRVLTEMKHGKEQCSFDMLFLTLYKQQTHNLIPVGRLFISANIAGKTGFGRTLLR